MRSRLASLTTVLAFGVALTSAAVAQEPYAIRALGTFQGQLQSSHVERPFFESLAKATAGVFDVHFRTMDEVGLKGFDAMRQLKLGVFNVMAVQLGYVSGDEPFVLGIDLPGVAPDLKTARVVVDSYRELFSSRLEAKYNAYTLALWPFPGQVFFCREKIGGLADLKGKKVRSFTPAMASLIQHFGGIPVTLAFSEVYQSLQRGVADCGITGTLSGNTSKWFEVTTHLYPLSIGWGVQAHLVNKDFLDKMTPGARTALIAQFKKLEAEMWDLAIKTFDDGVNCSVGKDPCQYGVKANMTLVPVNPDDVAKLREATLAAVLPVWAKECNANYPDCTKLWNQTVGKAVSLEIK